ncbi:beta strand repeat-containing protein [Flavobacterium sp.]|jgi:hypothetical protein|uniref:beta strand repeat-containing protein n=1 Tax=Flavobacterium sp. TaxID=239 RepID=UPI0037BEF480
MKKKYSKFVIYVFTWIALFIGNVVSGQNFSDNASSYASSWANNSNQGTGFGAWSLNAGASSGSFIGNPANNDMGTNGIGTTAFGMFATGSAYFNAYRSINNGIQVGDTFSFYWAINFDAGGGSKGFDLRSGGTNIFNVNNGGSSTITANNVNANTDYGTTPMLVTITRTSASAYSFSMTSRSGGATYTTTINSASTIDGFNFYIGNQNDGAGQKNMFVNGFSITKPITLADGNWNETAIWLNNTIPPTDASVTINHNISLNTDVSLRSILINNGKTLTASDSTPRTLTISNGGSLTNNGIFTAGNGTVAFAGSATVSGTITFNNATLAGGVNFGTGSIISGTLTINPGGFVSTNAPTYNSGATLRYNTNGPYGRGTEWSATSGNGYPHHVQISGNTIFNLNNGANVARQMGGNLTVDFGSTLSLEGMTIASPSEIGLTVVGNVINNGSISLASSTERLKCVNYTNNANALTTLSTNIGGDLELTGNFIDNAPFNSNNRAVFFTGSGVQDVTGSAPFDIDYIVSNKPSGSIRMLTNLLVEGPNGGNAITLTNATDILDLNGNTLTLGEENVASVFTGSGFIRGGSTSSISIQGTGALGTIRFDQSVPGTSNVLNNLTINRTTSGSVTIGNALNIIGVITVTAGTLESGGNITLKSNANGTAQVAAIGSGGSITGNVTVERYIPAKRAFRFLSPSVTTSTSIKLNWQENAGTTAGLGTHITGVDGITNGFDATSTNNPSLFTFNNSTGVWEAVTSTLTNSLTAGIPYRLMVRGDRLINLSTNTPTATPTVLRATGTLHTGNFSPTLNQTAEGFSFVGNPYQATVDIKAVLNAATNMNNGVVYYWDPTLNARGGYVTRTLGTTSENTPAISNFNEFLQPGQAVFVKKLNTSSAASMTFTESNKSVANAAAGVFRTANTSAYGLLRVNLQANTNNQWQTIEGTLALFNDNYSWNVTSEDATKMVNLDEEVSFVQNNTNLAIALQNNPSATSELPIKIDKMRHANYQWQFELDNYNGATPYLFDTLNNSYTQINNGTVVPFTADANTTNRFKIVFQNAVLSNATFQNTLAIYPNPAKAGASFYVEGISEATVTVSNLLGQTVPVQTKSQGTTLQVTPNTNLSQGVYLVNITTQGTTQQVKWIVE